MDAGSALGELRAVGNFLRQRVLEGVARLAVRQQHHALRPQRLDSALIVSHQHDGARVVGDRVVGSAVVAGRRTISAVRLHVITISLRWL